MKEEYEMLCGISISELDCLPAKVIIEKFKNAGGSIDEIDECGRSLLMLVKDPLVVNALWKLQADFNRKDYHNDSVLRHLSKNSKAAYNEAVRLLATRERVCA